MLCRVVREGKGAILMPGSRTVVEKYRDPKMCYNRSQDGFVKLFRGLLLGFAGVSVVDLHRCCVSGSIEGMIVEPRSKMITKDRG